MPTSAGDRIIPQYLNLLDEQRETAFQALAGLTSDQIWQRPEPGEWSIGEILNHNRLLFSSFFPLVGFTWRFFNWTGKLWRNRDYRTDMEDPYRKERVPMWVGFLWTPKYNPENPVPLETLKEELCLEHQRVRAFYEDKPEDLLGNVFVFDPLFGFINLILALRVGIYHDKLHYDDVIQMAKNF
ncbi:MAG: DinB family protein [Brevefilum sp.]